MNTHRLTWDGDRWHCDGRAIHAGVLMELKGAYGGSSWFEVRIESRNRGKDLVAVAKIQGLDFTYGIDPECDQLRWPV